MSANAWSNVLAACAIALFAIGHFLPVFEIDDVEFDGWKLVAMLIEYFRPVAADAWAKQLDQEVWFVLVAALFLPLFLIGVAGFFATARRHPRIAGVIAGLSGLCSMGSMAIWWSHIDSSGIWPDFASGFYVWFASMGLLFAAGMCKLIAVRKQPAA
jgi:hypothetical protein